MIKQATFKDKPFENGKELTEVVTNVAPKKLMKNLAATNSSNDCTNGSQKSAHITEIMMPTWTLGV